MLPAAIFDFSKTFSLMIKPVCLRKYGKNFKRFSWEFRNDALSITVKPLYDGHPL